MHNAQSASLDGRNAPLVQEATRRPTEPLTSSAADSALAAGVHLGASGKDHMDDRPTSLRRADGDPPTPLRGQKAAMSGGGLGAEGPSAQRA